MNFEDLTEGQKNAYTAAIKAIETVPSSSAEKRHLTINGPAGTGKTTLTKFLIAELIRRGERGVYLAAPTHQAKKVLSQHAGMEASTIHSLLKINPTTYEDSTTFEQKDVPDMSECRVLICDEASMYDLKLFQILMSSIPLCCTVIALGDIAQIRPVEPGAFEGQVSPFFTYEKFEQVSLTEVMRSNAPIIDVATSIRTGNWIYENVIDGAGVHNLTSERSVKSFMEKYFSIVKTPEDLFENRLLAFTNKSVDDLNKIVRKKIYNTLEPFIDGEVLVMQEPLIKSYTYEGKKVSEIVFNNGEMVKVLCCSQTSDEISVRGCSTKYMVRYWQLDLQSLDDPDLTGSINVIVDEAEINKLNLVLGKSAEQFKSGAVKAAWADWWKLKRNFHKVKALPCSTIHKSQGTSVDNVFLYTPCIHKADSQLAQQLLYVGATRARHNVYYI
ncbi:Dda DNA helicase [Acinetobacter phage Ac42]|uniref:Dda-like helicase n=1 Tax=Acinetobacter phage Ac42 TaxID=762660 RepID=UPI0001EBCC7A|nr:Dda-like helicase [Acinetobacter phage Ac42]ADI96262.1 Dda DNA helicase [Acinetobacter phage Ac42]